MTPGVVAETGKETEEVLTKRSMAAEEEMHMSV